MVHPERPSPRGDGAILDPEDFLAAHGDDPELALGRLMGTVQAELRRLAHRARCKHGGQVSLGTSDLVNEVYLRLMGGLPAVEDRAHFFAVAANTMRWILVSRERRRRGKEPVPTALADTRIGAAQVDLLDLDEALGRLKEHDAELASIVEQMYFLELTIDQIAAGSGLSPATVSRRLRVARRWLFQQLEATP